MKINHTLPLSSTNDSDSIADYWEFCVLRKQEGNWPSKQEGISPTKIRRYLEEKDWVSFEEHLVIQEIQQRSRNDNYPFGLDETHGKLSLIADPGYVFSLMKEKLHIISEDEFLNTSPSAFVNLRKIDSLCYPCAWTGEQSIDSLITMLQAAKEQSVEKLVIRTLQMAMETQFIEDRGETMPDHPRDSGMPLIFNARGHQKLVDQYTELENAVAANVLVSLNSIDFNSSVCPKMQLDEHFKHLPMPMKRNLVSVGELFVNKINTTEQGANSSFEQNLKKIRKVLEWAENFGLFVTMHLDGYMDTNPDWRYVRDFLSLRKKTKAPIIWAHGGIVSNDRNPQLKLHELLTHWKSAVDLNEVYIDLSWSARSVLYDEYGNVQPGLLELISDKSDRFIISTDFVVKKNRPDDYEGIYRSYDPLLRALAPEARDQLLYENINGLIKRSQRGIQRKLEESDY